MSNTWDFSDLDDDNVNDGKQKEDPNGPKALRAFAKKTSDENAELKKQLTEILAERRTSNVAKLIADKGLNPKVAKLIPDSVDATPEALGKWLEDYTDLFSPPQSNPSEENLQDDGTGELDSDVAALQRMAKAVNASMPPTKASDLMAQLNDKGLSKGKLMEMINAAGGGYGVG